MERKMQDPVVQAELIKEMAPWNANETCHRVILTLPLEPPPSLAQMIEPCTRKAELFGAHDRNLGLAHPKTAAPGARRSTDWTVIAVDLPDNLLDMTTNHMELESEYFVIGDTAHTPLEIEVAPMTINGDITNLILLARCPQPPFYLVEGQILPQAIPILVEVAVDGKSPEDYWAGVVDEEKPSLACNLTRGSDYLHVEGVLDTGADMTIIPERMWPSQWDLQPVAGKIQGVGGVKLAKISKSIVQIEGWDGILASFHLFVTDYKCPLWGRDTMSQWGVKLIIPKTPQDF
ncbi:hypothetical protein TURU_060652 [Turdus rufiventris]|nr:hypothetical protein TURU_060652 [Turdus rufiventris]